MIHLTLRSVVRNRESEWAVILAGGDGTRLNFATCPKHLVNSNDRGSPHPPVSMAAEWGDYKDARALFGLRRSLLYRLWHQQKIASIEIRMAGSSRGKRLYCLGSIRSYLESQKAY